MKKTRNISLLTVLVLIITCLCFNISFFPNNILSWDVFGYYLYLPQYFIYNDLYISDYAVIQEIIEKYNNTGTFYQAAQLPSGDWVMKYSMGMAILYAPFFFIGHLFANIMGYPVDGFSLPYQVAVFSGGILYTGLGLWFLRKLLLEFFGDITVAITIALIFIGTNFFFHSSSHGQNAMSHNFLFTFYVAILWTTYLWHKTHQIKHIIFLAIACGLTILCRPSEIVCLLIPLLWNVTGKNSLFEKINLLKEKSRQLFVFSIIILLIGSFQFIYWKLLTGKFLYYSYGSNAGEGLEFFHPYIFEVLFSFRKGWLLYTPIMIFSIIGFYFLYKQKKLLFLSMLCFFLTNLYIVSSWSCWWYAESFSQRALIQSYAVLAFPLGYFIQWLRNQKNTLKIAIFCLLFTLIAFNLFQTWQIHNGIIHGSRMTKDYYFAIFGRTSVTEETKKSLLINRSTDGIEEFNDEENYRRNTLEIIDFESLQEDNITTQYAMSGKASYQLDKNHIYSPAIEAPYAEITENYYAWIRASVMVYPISDLNSNPASLVICFEHNGYAYKYKALDFEKLNLELNKWNKVTYDYLTPEVRNKKDKLKVYVWHRGKEKIFIDDLKVEVFEPK